MRRVVITGIGVISPIGIGAKAFWENLLAGQVGVRRISHWDPSVDKAGQLITVDTITNYIDAKLKAA